MSRNDSTTERDRDKGQLTALIARCTSLHLTTDLLAAREERSTVFVIDLGASPGSQDDTLLRVSSYVRSHP